MKYSNYTLEQFVANHSLVFVVANNDRTKAYHLNLDVNKK